MEEPYSIQAGSTTNKLAFTQQLNLRFWGYLFEHILICILQIRRVNIKTRIVDHAQIAQMAFSSLNKKISYIFKWIIGLIKCLFLQYCVDALKNMIFVRSLSIFQPAIFFLWFHIFCWTLNHPKNNSELHQSFLSIVSLWEYFTLEWKRQLYRKSVFGCVPGRITLIFLKAICSSVLLFRSCSMCFVLLPPL